MKRTLIVFLGALLTMGTVISPLVFSEETVEEGEMAAMELSGEVVAVDMHNSVVEVKHLVDEASMTYAEMTFKVDPDTLTIEKGEEVIKLGDLKAGDKVVVKYTADKEGNNIASDISVESEM